MYTLLFALIPVGSDATFIVESQKEGPVTGKLIRLTSGFSATFAMRTGDAEFNDILSLRRANRQIPEFPTGPQLLTTSGDRIAGRFVGSERESLRFVPSTLGDKEDSTWLVPISAATTLWLADTPSNTPPDLNRYSWTEGTKNRDTIRFRNGDTIRGVLGLVPEAVKPTFRIRPDAGEARDIPASEVAAVVFNPLLAKARKPKVPFVRVVLADGSRLILVDPSIGNNVLKGETGFGQKIAIPLDFLMALDVFQTKAAYLSDLKPSKVEQSGFLGVTWTWVADRSVHGLPLRLTTEQGDSTFDKGLGTHPRTVLTYDLGGKYRRFEASVGLDPRTGERGRATVRVRVDGKEQNIPGLNSLTSGKAVVVRIDVTSAKVLTLEVDYSDTGGVQADVNWISPRLVE